MNSTTMASSIPMALSLISTVASTYQGLQKSGNVPTSTTSSSAAAPPPATSSGNGTNGASSSSTSGQTQSNAVAASSSTSGSGQSTIPLGNTTPSGASSYNAVVAVSPLSHGTISSLCDHCHQRPKYYDGTMTHPYCTKTCANKAKLANTTGNCDYCGMRPKFHDGHRTHDFCSKACAASAYSPGRKGGNGGKGTCQAPGCTKPPHASRNGTVGDYCSMAHKTLAESICLMCRQTPKMANSHFCTQACNDEAERKGPIVLEVPAGHATFKSVADQFKASWRHSNSSCPLVRRVYKIIAPTSNLAAYNAYKASVEMQGQFVASGRSAGNENRRWHGTRRECNLGDRGNNNLCKSPTCSLCCIIRTSFDLSLWGKKTGWGRFGKGIYTSSTSSKSNDYSSNDCKSNYKAILLNKVIVGKGLKLLNDNTNLTAPPPGYHSVLAEKGGTLNYDELVVYTNDAIRPSFLVLYEA